MNLGTLAYFELSSPPFFAAEDTRFNMDKSPPFCISLFPVLRSMFLPIADVIFCHSSRHTQVHHNTTRQYNVQTSVHRTNTRAALNHTFCLLWDCARRCFFGFRIRAIIANFCTKRICVRYLHISARGRISARDGIAQKGVSQTRKKVCLIAPIKACDRFRSTYFPSSSSKPFFAHPCRL